MTPYVYLVKVKSPICDNVFEYFLRFVSPEKKERISKQCIKQNADNMLVGEILAKAIIKKTFGIEIKKQVFKLSENGKPYLANFPDIHFSISHSGEYVMVAVSDKPVGADIQKIKKYNSAVMKKYYSDKEIKQIEESSDKDSEYTKIWTQKEAVIKKSDTGLAKVNIKNCVIGTITNSEKIDNYWLTVSK